MTSALIALLAVLCLLNLVMNTVLFRHLGIFLTGSARGIEDSGIRIGRPLPAVDVTATDGRPFSTSAKSGTPYILFFGATHCKECKSVLPVLARAADQSGLRIVAFVFAENTAMVKRFSSALAGSDNLVVHVDNSVGAKFDVAGVPFAFLVNGDGTVLAKGLTGTEGAVDALLASHLSARSSAAAGKGRPPGLTSSTR